MTNIPWWRVCDIAVTILAGSIFTGCVAGLVALEVFR